MLSSLFVVLTHVGAIPRYVTVLVFSRDLGILLIATLLFVTGSLRDFRPSLFGKANTLAQIVAVVVVMLQRMHLSLPLGRMCSGLLHLVAVLAPLSAAQYAWIVIRRMNAAPALPAG